MQKLPLPLRFRDEKFGSGEEILQIEKNISHVDTLIINYNLNLSHIFLSLWHS